MLPQHLPRGYHVGHVDLAGSHLLGNDMHVPKERGAHRTRDSSCRQTFLDRMIQLSKLKAWMGIPVIGSVLPM